MAVVCDASFPPEGLVDRLRHRGLCLRVFTEPSSVGTDHRLEIAAPDRGVFVELLGPLTDLPNPPTWHAVRVCGRRREVWAGPARSCGADQLCRFVLELLELAPDDLRERWEQDG